MVPPTSKTIVRPAVGALTMPYFNEPGTVPLRSKARLVTRYTSPPRPPVALAPGPSAPGNAGMAARAVAAAAKMMAKVAMRVISGVSKWFQRARKILHSADFWSGARCAPERTNAQRAAPFGKLGTVGFVLNDFFCARSRLLSTVANEDCDRARAHLRASRPVRTKLAGPSSSRPLPILGG